MRCSVLYCKSKNSVEGDVRFHAFPKNSKMRSEWIKACGKKKENINIKFARVCSEHFTESDYRLQDILLNEPKKKMRLKEGAFPSVNVCGSEKTNIKASSSRIERYKKRMMKELVEEAVTSYDRLKQESIPDCLPEGEINLKEIEEVFIKNEKITEDEEEEEEMHLTDIAVQTEVDLESGRELKIISLEGEIRRSKATLKKLLEKVHRLESEQYQVHKIFTPGQLRRLKEPTKKLRWTDEDMASAIALYSAGTRCYRLLRKRSFPLPSVSTLMKWAAKLIQKPGILSNVRKLLAEANYNEIDRICVLSFVKIKIKSSSNNDESVDETLQPSKYAQVAMVRGLVKNWKQVIYYNFDTPMSFSVLKTIIESLREISFDVVAVVANMGPTNLALWNELDISENQPFIQCSDIELDKIFFFANTPHLIKLIRNNFVDKGFVLEDKVIDSEPVREMLLLEDSDLKSFHKLTPEHLNVKRAGRQKLSTTTQLFSQSVSSCIRKCISLGKMNSPNAIHCSDFLQLVNDWFDIFNSNCSSADTNDIVKAYGLSSDVENKIIAEMTETMKKLRTPKSRTLLPFQTGILLNNASMLQLFIYLKKKYSLKYIITSRLSQVELEQIFYVVRSKRSLLNHPTPIEFKYRLRSCILGNF